MAFFVIDENHNLIEAYDKEGVLAVLEQAIADGSLANLVADAGFVSKLKCCVSGQTNKIAFVTQAKYNELEANGQVQANVYYYITDDTTLENINSVLADLNTAVSDIQSNIEKIVSGETAVAKATKATEASLVDVYSEKKLTDYVSSIVFKVGEEIEAGLYMFVLQNPSFTNYYIDFILIEGGHYDFGGLLKRGYYHADSLKENLHLRDEGDGTCTVYVKDADTNPLRIKAYARITNSMGVNPLTTG